MKALISALLIILTSTTAAIAQQTALSELNEDNDAAKRNDQTLRDDLVLRHNDSPQFLDTTPDNRFDAASVVDVVVVVGGTMCSARMGANNADNLEHGSGIFYSVYVKIDGLMVLVVVNNAVNNVTEELFGNYNIQIDGVSIGQITIDRGTLIEVEFSTHPDEFLTEVKFPTLQFAGIRVGTAGATTGIAASDSPIEGIWTAGGTTGIAASDSPIEGIWTAGGTTSLTHGDALIFSVNSATEELCGGYNLRGWTSGPANDMTADIAVEKIQPMSMAKKNCRAVHTSDLQKCLLAQRGQRTDSAIDANAEAGELDNAEGDDGTSDEDVYISHPNEEDGDEGGVIDVPDIPHWLGGGDRRLQIIILILNHDWNGDGQSLLNEIVNFIIEIFKGNEDGESDGDGDVDNDGDGDEGDEDGGGDEGDDRTGTGHHDPGNDGDGDPGTWY